MELQKGFEDLTLNSSDEKYRQKLIKQSRMMLFSGLISLFLSGFLLVMKFYFHAKISTIAVSSVVGGGVGLGASLIVYSFWYRRITKNPKKLHQHRVKNFDERNMDIEAAAGRATVIAMETILMILMVIAAFINIDYAMVLWGVIVLLIAVFALSLLYYKRKM